MKDIKKLKKENKALKQTCEILGNTKLMNEIKASLRRIEKGRFIKLADL